MLSTIPQGFNSFVNHNTGNIKNLNPLKIGVEKLQLGSSKGALGKPALKTISKGSKNNILLWIFLSILPLSSMMAGGIGRENSTNLEKGQFWTVLELPKEKDIPTYKDKASSSWQIPRNSTTHGNGHKLLLLYATCKIRWWWLQLHEAAHFTTSPPNN